MAADSLTIKIGIDGSKQASTELQAIGKSAEKMGSSLSRAGKSAWEAVEGMADRFDRATRAAGTLAKAGALVVGPLAALATPAYAVASALDDVSTSLNDVAKRAADAGTTASDFDTLSGALGLLTRGGVDTAKILQTLDRRLGEAKDKASPAAQAFRDLGVSVEDLAGRTGTGKIAAVATAMSQLATDQDRARLSAKLFEEQGQALAGVWRQGGDAVMRAAEQVRAAGVILDADAANAEGYRDAIDLLSRSLTTLRRDSLTPLLPQATEFVGLLADIAQNAAATGGLSDLASWLLDVSYGATLAARDLGIMLGVLSGDTGDAKAKAVEAQADIVQGLKDQIEAQKEVERTGAAMSRALGVELEEGPSAAVQGLTAQLDAALRKLRELRGEWVGGRGGGGGGAGGGGGGGMQQRALAAIPAAAPLLPEMAGDFGSEAEALRWIADIEAEQHAARVAREVERIDLIEQRRVAELSAAEEAERIQRESLDRQLSAAEGFARASATIWNTVAQAIVDSTRKGTKARRDALLAQWIMEKVAANAQLTIDSIQSISASASVGFPAAIPAVAAAVALAVANRVALNAASPPNLVADAGVSSADLRRSGFTGRQTVLMRDGETVLGPQASSDAARIADSLSQVRSRVESSGMGGDVFVRVEIGGEQVEAVVTRMQADSIRRGDHTLPLALRDARL